MERETCDPSEFNYLDFQKDINMPSLVTRLFLTLPLLAFAAFCAFGFLHSFEPGANNLAFKIGYATLGSISAVGIGALLRPTG